MISICFIIWPEIDLWAAHLFYNRELGFVLRGSSLNQFTDEWIRPGAKNFVLMMMTLACVSLASRGRLLAWPPRQIAFVALTFAVGPGLIVNALLKQYVGRARPKYLIEFGGDKDFSYAYFPSDQCVQNCSFVSGDVAFVIGFVTLAVFLTGIWRILAFISIFLLGMITAFYRMGTGAHFMSDTILAALFTVIVAIVCYNITIGSKADKNIK